MNINVVVYKHIMTTNNISGKITSPAELINWLIEYNYVFTVDASKYPSITISCLDTLHNTVFLYDSNNMATVSFTIMYNDDIKNVKISSVKSIIFQKRILILHIEDSNTGCIFDYHIKNIY